MFYSESLIGCEPVHCGTSRVPYICSNKTTYVYGKFYDIRRFVTQHFS